VEVIVLEDVLVVQDALAVVLVVEVVLAVQVAQVLVPGVQGAPHVVEPVQETVIMPANQHQQLKRLLI